MILEPEALFAFRDQFIEASEEHDINKALDLAPNLSSGRIAQILSECDNDFVIPFIEQVDEKHAADILIKLPREMAADIFHLINPDIAVKLIDRVPVDDAADIIELLDKEEASQLLDRINPDIKKVINDLMLYEQGTVGSVMNTYFIAVREGSTVGETLKAMKDAPTQIQNRAYVYVVDSKGRPQGVVSMKDLIRTDP